MTFGDEISSSICSIFDTISSYPIDAINFKQDLEEIIASLEFLLVKYDNTDKTHNVEIQAFNVILNHVPKQIDAAINGCDPFKHLPNVSQYVRRCETQNKEEQKRSKEDIIKKINSLIEKYNNVTAFHSDCE